MFAWISGRGWPPMMPQSGVDRLSLRTVLDTVTGALLCVWLAITAALVGQTWPYPPELLILFVPAIGMVARVWGLAGALLGLASACVILRVGLFGPIGRFEVASGDARTVLFWTIFGAVVAAYVFARPQRTRTDTGGGGGSC